MEVKEQRRKKDRDRYSGWPMKKNNRNQKGAVKHISKTKIIKNSTQLQNKYKHVRKNADLKPEQKTKK